MGTEVVSTLALSGLQRTSWPSAAGSVVGIGGAAVLRVHGEDKGVWGSPPFPRDRLVGALLGPGLGGEDSLRESRVLGS